MTARERAKPPKRPPWGPGRPGPGRTKRAEAARGKAFGLAPGVGGCRRAADFPTAAFLV
jgi:hypothetical protein